MDHLGFLAKFQILKSDYTGITFNPLASSHFLLSILFSLFLLLLMYFIGKKVLTNILHTNLKNPLGHFSNFAVGYIFLGTGIAILGLISQLYIQTILAYLVLISLFAFYKENFFLLTINCYKFLKKFIKQIDFQKLSLIVVLIIIFIRVFPPEIGPDALEYHLNYPKIYLERHTTLVSQNINEGDSGVISIPQLAEMDYIITESLGLSDSSRFIHFYFFALVILLLYFITNDKKYNKIFDFAPILVALSPLVLHIAPSAYSDFQTVYCFILPLIIISLEKHNFKNIMLSGIIFGGLLATKIWGLLYFGLFFLILFLLLNKIKLNVFFKNLFIFTASSISIALLWYFRSFLIAGSFFSVTENPQQKQNMEAFSTVLGLFHFYPSYYVTYFYNFFPLIFVGIFILFFCFKYFYKLITKFNLLKVSVISTIYGFIIFSAAERYLLTVLPFMAMVASVGLQKLSKNIFAKVIIFFIIISFTVYYLINSLVVLPYGIGILSKEKYFIRNLYGYYNYDNKFAKLISPSETVAVYGTNNYYYATFNYKNIYYFLDKKSILFKNMKKKNVSKLLIYGGDIKWFCNQLNLPECKNIKFMLLSSFLPKELYLYQIR